MVVQWSACLPSILSIRVLIPLKYTIFLLKLFSKRTKINKKAGVSPLKNGIRDT